jgi:hypothetical protein
MSGDCDWSERHGFIPQKQLKKVLTLSTEIVYHVGQVPK